MDREAFYHSVRKEFSRKDAKAVQRRKETLATRQRFAPLRRLCAFAREKRSAQSRFN
jgi:hypothetical protein